MELFLYCYVLILQVLSESVAKALRLLGGPEVEETARFCSMMDKFFDAMNVGNFTCGRQSRKAFKAPYRSASDFRLTVSEIMFCSEIVLRSILLAHSG